MMPSNDSSDTTPAPSAATGRSIGNLLREARKASGLSIADISEETKIGKRFLEFIEQDAFHRLPGGIFNRAFLRSYAREVGVPEDDVVRLYNAVAKDKTKAQHSGNPAAKREQATILLLAVIAFSLLLTAWYLWGHFSS